MLSKKIVEALSEQMNKEIYSGYFYLGMSDYAASIGLKGFAHWFYKQWGEELFHAKKILDYVNKNGQRAALKAIERPPQDFTSGKDLFEKTLAHEKKVTALIKELAGLAKKENDRNTENLIEWFIKEQVEEEATPAAILKKIEESGGDLKNIDAELAKRK